MPYRHPWISALIFWTLIGGASPASATALRLTWQDTSSAESGFKIERLSGSNYVEIASVGANVGSFSDTNLTAGASYCYRVRAFNATGVSPPTNAACATAPAVASPSTSSGGTLSSPSSTPTTGTTSSPTSSPGVASGKLWTDYVVSAKILSSDNDAVGIMFRYQDEDNYYRFSWYAEGKTRRLEKRVNGVFKVLAQDSAVYSVGRSYAVQISASGSSLKVAIDGATIFSVTDASLNKGTIALYSYYNAGGYFDDIQVHDLVSGNLLLSENFSDGDFIGWTVVDEGNEGGPSAWKIVNGSLAQTSNIGSTGGDNGRVGTYALYTRGSWVDYRVAVKIRSSDNDFIGVMFRVQDSNNYYRLSWEQGTPGRRLWKREKGAFKLLAEDTVPYATNQTYSLEIIAQGTTLKVNIDGKSVFSVSDQSFKGGAVALYSSFNQSSFFDDLLVQDLLTNSTLLWDDFNDGNLTGWKVFDEAGTYAGPSVWSVANGALVQSSNIGSDATGKPGTFLLY